MPRLRRISSPRPLTSGFGSPVATTTLAIPASATTGRTGGGPSDMAARLERAVQRRATRALAGITQRVHFRVRSAGDLVRSRARQRRLRDRRRLRPPSDWDWSGRVRARPAPAREPCNRCRLTLKCVSFQASSFRLPACDPRASRMACSRLS